MTQCYTANGGLLHAIVMNSKKDTVFVAQNVRCALDKCFSCFVTTGVLEYYPCQNEFGPFNVSGIVRFIRMLESKIAAFPNHKILYYVESGRQHLTHAVYLLGAYMLLKHSATIEDVLSAFSWVDENIAVPFSDPDSGFELTLKDCWKCLARIRDLGWLRVPADLSAPGAWGRIDPDEYDHYHNAVNADLHEVVPGELILFNGPKRLGGREYLDDERGRRLFSPAYYIGIFQEMGVAAVASMEEAEYDAQEFEEHGIAHHALDAPRGAIPPPAVAERLFQAVALARGPLALHCGESRGRPGALAALYLMRRRGFPPREAVAWLSICRPGALRGPAPHLLCLDAARGRDDPEPRRASAPSPAAQQQRAPPAPSPGPAAPQRSASFRVAASAGRRPSVSAEVPVAVLVARRPSISAASSDPGRRSAGN